MSVLTGCMLLGCRDNYSPKPKGFVRIALPEKSFQSFDSLFPYAFKYPEYSQFSPDQRESSEPYWANIEFPAFKGTLYLSYKKAEKKDDLVAYFEDARSFTQRHIPKATAILEEVIFHPENKVFGTLYEIQGRDVASPVQFYVTDSLSHFLRGALYFQVTPNNDSLAPVIDFLNEDIHYMLSTLQWK